MPRKRCCCTPCIPPDCQLFVQIDDNCTAIATWSHGPAVTSATLNGVNVLAPPIFLKTFTKPNIPNKFELIVDNACGTKKCEFITPCCWNKQTLRKTISGLSDMNKTCTRSRAFNPLTASTTVFYSVQVEWTGLTALNGVYDYNIPKCNCGEDLRSILISSSITLSISKVQTTTGVTFPNNPNVPVVTSGTVKTNITISGIKLFLEDTGLVIQLPPTGTTSSSGTDYIGNTWVSVPTAPGGPPGGVVRSPLTETLRQTPISLAGIQRQACPGPTTEFICHLPADPISSWVTGPPGFLNYIHANLNPPIATVTNPVPICGPSDFSNCFEVTTEYLP